MLHADKLGVLLIALLACHTVSGQSVEETDSEAVQAASKSGPDGRSADPAAVARLIVDKTNEFRIAHDGSKVAVNLRLAETAQYFASYMAKNDVYGHHADDNRPSQRATKYGYDYCLVSENIAYQYDSTGFTSAELAEHFVEGWKSSTGHRENMLDKDVVETGVAVARSDHTGYWYAVQMFGRPKAAAVRFEIENKSASTIEYSIRGQTFQLPPRYTRTHIRCRPPKVNFGFQSGENIEPSNGSHFAIVDASGKLELQKEGATSQ